MLDQDSDLELMDKYELTPFDFYTHIKKIDQGYKMLDGFEQSIAVQLTVNSKCFSAPVNSISGSVH